MSKLRDNRYVIYIILSLILTLVAWKGENVTEYVWHIICLLVGFVILDVVFKSIKEMF